MADIFEYKCPCCGGALSFDSSIQKIKCPYCDTEFEMDALRKYDASLNNQTDNMKWDKPAGSEWGDGEADDLRSYVCNSCGGEIIGDVNTAATSCPYCGNPVVMMGQFTGVLKPDYVIPFKLDKNAAKAALMNHLEGKKLLPKVFKDQNHIDEIKGIYIPFWLFDADADADIRYKATKKRVYEDLKNTYTETSYYGVNRVGTLSFSNVPVDGSSKMDDSLMESIEPFNFGEAVDFQTAYLAGYFADKYDMDVEACIPRANQRIKTSTEEAFKSTVSGYETLEVESSSINLENSRAKYTLCPVWLLNTTWNGNKYTFAMNGQTGKFVGDLPMDKRTYHKYYAAIGAGIAAAAFLLQFLLFK